MRLLLIDTCGDNGSLALTEDGVVLRERTLAARSASAYLVSAIRSELAALAWSLREIDAVGVVSGPGSFTGLRVGLAAAKGLCDVAGLTLVALSRLEVLLSAGAAATEALAVLDAGRGEFYVRAGSDGEERLLERGELLDLAVGRPVLVAEERLLASLASLEPKFVELVAGHALPLAMAQLRTGSDSVETVDANYVRNARALYAARPNAPGTREHT